ncbi:MFS general substrate transporter [Massarina eburnea CBS 473.64]|uniref:MFS general substrate transporter n=1 Tax=Massarina eburnea CBS 473.64 TaxID=1395130 RepID=A0A6A6SG00_9PLEO|nr:MFS general substrate transporter [Massarina eburnea CBS 473.64]
MDINALVYGNAKAPIPPRPDIYIDEDAESQKRTWPLSRPRPLSAIAEGREDLDETLSTSHAATKSKHESYDLSGSVFLITNDGNILSLPMPSDSKHDPLNWSRWKTLGAMLALGWFSVTALTVVQAASLMMKGINRDFREEDAKPWTVETLVTAPTLFMGIGAFIWVPLSLALGRRPVFLLAALVNFLATLSAGYAETFNQLLLCICFLGLGEGFALTSALLMLIDMSFIHQRPTAIAALWSAVGLFGTGGLFCVPYLSDQGLDWRLFYHTWSIPTGAAFLLAYFLAPETYFKRPTVAFNGLILLQSASEKLTVFEDHDKSDLYRDLPEFPIDNPKGQGIMHLIGFGRSPFASWKSMGRCYLQIGFCFINPLIFWVLVASSVNFAGMMFIGTTFSIILSASPYKRSSHQIAFVNLSSGIGGAIAFLFVGILMCSVLKYLSKRNKGVREAEHYLIGYIPTVFTGALSTLFYGLAVHYKWHFSVYYIAYGLNGFSWVSLSIGNTLWVTEAFPRWAAPALVVVGGGCYLLSYSMSFALVPWINAHGYLLVGIELTVLQVVTGLIAIPIAFWGKGLRQRIHGRWANERGGALRPV